MTNPETKRPLEGAELLEEIRIAGIYAAENAVIARLKAKREAMKEDTPHD